MSQAQDQWVQTLSTSVLNISTASMGLRPAHDFRSEAGLRQTRSSTGRNSSGNPPRHHGIDLDQWVFLRIQTRVTIGKIKETHLRHDNQPPSYAGTRSIYTAVYLHRRQIRRNSSRRPCANAEDSTVTHRKMLCKRVQNSENIGR